MSSPPPPSITPRSDTSIAALRTAIQDDHRANAIRRRSIPGERVIETDGLVAYLSDVRSPEVNEVVQARFDAGEAADDAIEEAIAAFGDRPFFWWVGEDDRPADLGARLARRGLAFLDDIPGMAMDLADLVDRETARSPAELTIEPILDEAGIDAYHAVLSRGFPEDFVDVATAAAITAATRRMAAETEYREPNGLPTFWLGTVDSRPVTTTRLHVGAGVAGIYGVVTVDDARRRGYGEALTRHVLHVSREHGLRIAVLQASAAGRGVYERIGFRSLYDYRLYEWRPEHRR